MLQPVILRSKKILVLLNEAYLIDEIKNLETDETLKLPHPDGFEITFETETVRQKDCFVENCEAKDDRCCVRFRCDRFTILLEYRLDEDWHFIQSRLHIQPNFNEPYLIQSIVLCRWPIPLAGIRMIPFRHGQCMTYFFRKAQSAFLTGIQVPIADDEQKETADFFTAGYRANYKMEAGEAYRTETLFWCCGKLTGQFPPAVSPRIKECCQSAIPPDLGEVSAMLEMVKIQKPPVLRDIYINYNGCQGGGSYKSYTGDFADEAISNDQALLENVMALFGHFNWISSTTWGGASDAVRSLTPADTEMPQIPKLDSFYRWCGNRGIDISAYMPMKGIFPWGFKNGGEHMYGIPYCENDRSWQGICEQTSSKGAAYNCPVNRPFMKWFTKIVISYIRRYSVKQFSSDEWLPSPRYSLPCRAANHDHLPGDASYGYFYVRRRFFEELRKEFGPALNLNGERPQMDCGIWDALYLDSVFTLTEINCGENGDDIRTWSRTRRYYHFFPSYIDEVAVKLGVDDTDYIMLSILAVSNNYLFLSSPGNWSRVQKQKVRKWLDWARANTLYMQSDTFFLPVWPGTGACDMYARAIDGEAYLFIFNAGEDPCRAVFPIANEYGLITGAKYSFQPIYPKNAVIPKQQQDALLIDMPKRGALLLKATLL